MHKLAKYALFVYIILTISMIYTISPIKSFEKPISIALMALGLLLVLIYSNILLNPRIINAFRLVYSLMIINLLYQFTFGWLEIRVEDYFYLFAKISLTIIIAVSIALNPNFYGTRIFKILGYILGCLFLLGFVTSQVVPENGRYHFGFGNPNEAGAVAAIGFGIALIKENYPKLIKSGLLALFVVAAILTGSRAAMIFILLSFFIKYKIKTKLLIGLLIFAVVIIIVLPYFNMSTIGMERLMDTYDPVNKRFVTNRNVEGEAGYLMFLHKFWTGYGLSAAKIIDQSILPYSFQMGRDLTGTHNGYICAAKMYGIIFLIPFIYTIIFNYIKLFRRYFNSQHPDILLHLYIVSIGVVGALVEDYFIGVNSVVTLLCFMSFSVLGYYQSKGQIIKKKIRT